MKNKIGRNIGIFEGKKWSEIILFLIFAAQFLLLCYFNLKLLGNHTGYDSSWSYLKAALMWKEKSLNSSMWIDQTSLFLDSSMTLATIIYGITGNLFVSYGIANLVVVVLILVCMYAILSKLDLGIRAKVIALNLIVCPYLTNGFDIGNDLGYFSSLLSGAAFYSLRALIVLIIIYEFICIKQRDRIDVVGYISFFLCALAGVSSGIFIIVVILLPYIVYELELVLIKNDWKQLTKKECIYVYGNCISVICGKLFAKYILGSKVIDESRTWTSLEQLWTNIGSVIQGFMKLLGVLPVSDTSISVLSAEGIYRIFPIIIFCIVIISIGFFVFKIRNNLLEKDGVLLFLLNIILVNFLVFCLFNVRYGAELFEERYLVSTYMVVIVMIAYYVNQLHANMIFSQVIICGLILALLGNNYVSDKKYIETTNDSWQIAEISSIVDTQDVDLIYFWGDEISPLGRTMRVYDLDHIYKEIVTSGGYDHWGDYLYYDDNGDYTGSTLLIIPKGTDVVPENILNQYKFIEDLNWVSVYRCDYNPIDMTVGITGDTSIDYPSTNGMGVQHGYFDGNSYITDGTGGFVMWGPYCVTENGSYDFILDYQIIDGSTATFDIAIDSGTIQLGAKELTKLNTEAVISDVQLEDGHTLEYRVMCEEGTKIQINKVTIMKK